MERQPEQRGLAKQTERPFMGREEQEKMQKKRSLI